MERDPQEPDPLASKGCAATFVPSDPTVQQDPHPTFAALRERCPVVHSDELGGFWLLTRYDDVVRVASDTATFISGVQNVIPKLPDTGKRGPLHLDPPEHTPYRRALSPAFGPAAVLRAETRVRAVARELVADLVAAGEADAVAGLTAQLPIRALAVLLGLDEDLAKEATRATEAFVRAIHRGDDDAVRSESLRVYDLARAAIRGRRSEGRDEPLDGLDALLSIELGGEPIEEETAVGTLRQLIVAAHVGPALALASALRHLAEDDTLQRELRQDPALVPEAIEELLRLHTPSTGFARTPTRPVELGGVRIETDEPIAVNYAAANRDPEVFEEPDRFRWGRDPARHVAFGRGIHKCVGRDLALLLMRVAVEEALAQTSHIHPVGSVEALPFAPFPEHGPLELPLRFEAREPRSDQAGAAR